MTDPEWNQQDRTTAGAISAHNEATEDARRAAVNAYSAANGLIDDQQDLINEYRGSGLNQMRAVQSYVDGNKKDWEEVQKAIDEIAQEEKSLITSKRGFLAALFAVGAGTAAGGSWAFLRGTGTREMEYSKAASEEFEEFYDGLRTSQKQNLGLIQGDEQELFGEEGRDIIAFEARDDEDPSTEPKYKLWVEFPGGEIDDYNWQEWNRDDYNQFTRNFGTYDEGERTGSDGYIQGILEGDNQ